MTQKLAWHNGSWLDRSNVAISLADPGFLQGAVIVERLRTVGGQPLDTEAHLDRFMTGCQAIGLPTQATRRLDYVIAHCAIKNAEAYGGDDFSIVVLATPEMHDSAPNLIVHTSAIAWQRLATWYRSGQHLVVASAHSVPSDCWSPQIKNRSRLNYYLADQQAAADPRPHVGSVLPNAQGHLTDTSFANLILVEGERIVCAPESTILYGISLQRTLRLAAQAGLPIEHTSIDTPRAEAADAILLCGTTGCLWPASSMGSRAFDDAIHQPTYRTLYQLWCEDLGFDYQSQAIQQISANT